MRPPYDPEAQRLRWMQSMREVGVDLSDMQLEILWVELYEISEELRRATEK